MNIIVIEQLVFTVWTTKVSNLIRYPNFRKKVSVVF